MCVHEVRPDHPWITFGKIENSNLVFNRPNGRPWKYYALGREPQIQFCIGNYILSVIGSSAPTIVIHEEHVDPNKLIQKLSDQETSDPNNSDRKRNRNASGGQNPFQAPPKLISVPEICQFCERNPSNRFCHPRVPVIEAQILHQLYQAHKSEGNFVAKGKALRYRDLFYFVSEYSWTAKKSIAELEISLLESNIYQILLDRKIIGFAVNLDDFMQDGPKRGLLIRDSTDGYFALILQDVHGEHDQDCTVLDISKESVLYDVGLNFVQMGNKRMKIEDGSSGWPASNASKIQSNFDFSRLPSNVFVKILLYLPWNERMINRGVSKQWFEMGNSVLATSTKMINDEFSPFSKMKSEDFQWLLPIVAGGLETLYLNEARNAISLPTPIPLFPSLQKADLTNVSLSVTEFLAFLDHCPNLKKLTPPPLSGSSIASSKRYNVEKLIVIHDMADMSLMDFVSFFPNLVSLFVVMAGGMITKSEISAVVNRLDKLRRLSLDACLGFPGVGTFNIHPWSKLTSLALFDGGNLVSDAFLIALTKQCMGLESLDVSYSKRLTKNGISALVALDNLKILNIRQVKKDLNEAITAIAMKGRLEQLCAKETSLNVDCLKTCIRCCPRLQLLDIRDSGDLTAKQAKEVAHTFGQCGGHRRLVIRSRNPAWLDKGVFKVQKAILNGEYFHQGRLVIDVRHYFHDCKLLKDKEIKYYNNGLIIDEDSQEKVVVINGNSDESESEEIDGDGSEKGAEDDEEDEESDESESDSEMDEDEDEEESDDDYY